MAVCQSEAPAADASTSLKLRFIARARLLFYRFLPRKIPIPPSFGCRYRVRLSQKLNAAFMSGAGALKMANIFDQVETRTSALFRATDI